MVGVARRRRAGLHRSIAVDSRREDFERESALQRGDSGPRPSFEGDTEKTADLIEICRAKRQFGDVVDHCRCRTSKDEFPFSRLEFVRVRREDCLVLLGMEGVAGIVDGMSLGVVHLEGPAVRELSLRVVCREL